MKKLFLTLTMAVLAAFGLRADSSVDEILSQLRKYRLSFTYEYTLSGLQDVTVEGRALVQRDCFRIEGGGLMVLCDSQNTWTIDLEGKEAYVENSGPMDYASLLLSLEWDGDTLKGTCTEPSSGTIVPFRIYDIKKSPISGDLSDFSPSTDFFNDGGDWIITDLR